MELSLVSHPFWVPWLCIHGIPGRDAPRCPGLAPRGLWYPYGALWTLCQLSHREDQALLTWRTDSMLAKLVQITGWSTVQSFVTIVDYINIYKAKQPMPIISCLDWNVLCRSCQKEHFARVINNQLTQSSPCFSGRMKPTVNCQFATLIPDMVQWSNSAKWMMLRGIGHRIKYSSNCRVFCQQL